MKTALKPILICISIAFAGMGTALGAEGSGTRGGGDEYAIVFVQIANNLEMFLANYGSSLSISVNLLALDRAVRGTRVDSTDQALIVDGSEKDAINYPYLGRITFNRARWDAIPSYNGKMALVFHEYLGILGVDDSKYQISSHIAQSIQNSLDAFVDYDRMHMKGGRYVCRALQVGGSTVTFDMAKKVITWNGIHSGTRVRYSQTYSIRVLDILNVADSSSIAINIVGECGTSRIQMISAQAVDSFSRGSFHAMAAVHGWGPLFSSWRFDTQMECQSGL